MITIIPLKKQSNYEQLRFALRSLDKYHSTNVAIIGPEIPTWCNAIHIPFPDATHHEWKAKNIFDKIKKSFEVLKEERILFMNDDHILLHPVNYFHHKGSLLEGIKSRNPIGTYTQTLKNTFEVFGNVNDFDTHCPIWYYRPWFENINLDWTEMHGYGIKTSYCAVNKIEGSFYPDLQFYDKIGDIENRLYFAVNDNCQLDRLKELFPNKCKFEK